MMSAHTKINHKAIQSTLKSLSVGLLMGVLMLSGYLLARPSVASAAGPQCFVFVQAGYYRKIDSGCPSDPSIDPNNDSSTTFICYWQPDTAQRQGRTGFQQKNCLEMVQANQQCVDTNCYSGATVDGTGGSKALPAQDDRSALDTGAKGDTCGGGTSPQGVELDSVETIINIGCRGQGNPIVDLAFAIIRILSIGVGIVVVGSVVLGGIQYTTAGGDPQKTAAAMKRIASSVGALVLYIFIYALLNWVIPAGVFN